MTYSRIFDWRMDQKIKKHVLMPRLGSFAYRKLDGRLSLPKLLEISMDHCMQERGDAYQIIKDIKTCQERSNVFVVKKPVFGEMSDIYIKDYGVIGSMHIIHVY